MVAKGKIYRCVLCSRFDGPNEDKKKGKTDAQGEKELKRVTRPADANHADGLHEGLLDLSGKRSG